MNNPFELIHAELSNMKTILLDIKHQQAFKIEKKADTPDQFDTIQDAAKLLKLSVPTVYSKYSKGELPGGCKRGGEPLFPA